MVEAERLAMQVDPPMDISALMKRSRDSPPPEEKAPQKRRVEAEPSSAKLSPEKIIDDVARSMAIGRTPQLVKLRDGMKRNRKAHMKFV